MLGDNTKSSVLGRPKEITLWLLYHLVDSQLVLVAMKGSSKAAKPDIEIKT